MMLGCMLLVMAAFAGFSEEVRRFDHNKDGKPDQWEYYRDGACFAEWWTAIAMDVWTTGPSMRTAKRCGQSSTLTVTAR